MPATHLHLPVQDIARIMRCSLPQLAAQYELNLSQLRVDLARAELSGKKVRGYSASDLEARVNLFTARIAECAAS